MSSNRRKLVNARKPVNVINFGANGNSSLRQSLRPFTIDVDWTPSYSDRFIPTSDEVEIITGITAYRLKINPSGSIFSYTLEFINTLNYDYYFTDTSGDVYEVNTFRNGLHYLDYNSSSPNIFLISGK